MTNLTAGVEAVEIEVGNGEKSSVSKLYLSNYLNKYLFIYVNIYFLIYASIQLSALSVRPSDFFLIVNIKNSSIITINNDPKQIH